MLKLSERTFMKKISNINKLVDVLVMIALLSSLLAFTDGSMAIFLTCPILLALIYLSRGRKQYFLIFLGSMLMGLLFTDLTSIFYNMLALGIISLLFIGLTKSDYSDKNQILISFAVISLLFIIFYKISMLEEGLTIESMAIKLKEIIQANTSYDFDMEIYRQSVAMYPSILSGIGLLYSIFSLKVIRNYLAYKGLSDDMKSLNSIRITRKDAIIFLVIATVIYLIFKRLGINSTYIIANIIWIMFILLLLNGLLIYDYLMSENRTLLSRGLSWFFIIIFFSFFAIFFIMLGLMDMILDIRRRVRRPRAREEKL